MLDKIKKICTDGDLCAIYTDVNDTDKFMVGYVLDCIDEAVFMRLVDPYGHYDGICWILLEKIYRVETETQYLAALVKLIEYYKESKLSCKSVYTFDEIVKAIKDNHRICSIELCESDDYDITGYIANVTDSTIEIDEVTKYGVIDGHTVVAIDTISSIGFDATDTVKLEILAS